MKQYQSLQADKKAAIASRNAAELVESYADAEEAMNTGELFSPFEMGGLALTTPMIDPLTKQLLPAGQVSRSDALTLQATRYGLHEVQASEKMVNEITKKNIGTILVQIQGLPQGSTMEFTSHGLVSRFNDEQLERASVEERERLAHAMEILQMGVSNAHMEKQIDQYSAHDCNTLRQECRDLARIDPEGIEARKKANNNHRDFQEVAESLQDFLRGFREGLYKRLARLSEGAPVKLQICIIGRQ